MSVSEILNNSCVSSILQTKGRRGTVTLSHNSTIAEALETLADEHLLSAPIVVDPDVEDNGTGMDIDATPTLIGWLDLKDILASLLAFIDSKNTEKKLPTMMLSLMSSLEKAGSEFLNKLLVSVPCREDRKLLPIDDAPSTSLMTIIRGCFIEPELSHRVALYDAHGEIVDVVSQLDVLTYIYRSLSDKAMTSASLDLNMERSLDDLGFLQKGRPLVSVNAHEPMLHALAKMAKEGVSSAPVLASDNSSMIANLSLSDLRALRSEHFGVLALPCAEYLALLHGTAYIGYSRSSSEHSHHPYFASEGSKHPKPADLHVYAIRGSTSLISTIRTLTEHRLHHVYVIDDLGKVDAVVAITDVLQYIAGVY